MSEPKNDKHRQRQQYNVRNELSLDAADALIQEGGHEGRQRETRSPGLNARSCNPVAAPDSSDEEETELLRLGEQGK